jgi:glycosyltransferase involved in cell wall biosynthesis
MYVQYMNPAAYPPLINGMRLLAEAGCEVLVLGATRRGDPLALVPQKRIQARMLRMAAPGWRQRVRYAGFVLWALLWFCRWRPEWVYVSDPPSTPLALLLSLLPGTARIIYHEHDSPPANGSASRSISVHVIARLRRLAVRRSHLCVLPNDERARVLALTTGRAKPLVVWNCPSRAEVWSQSTPRSDGLRLVYHGSIVPPRLPLTVIEALARLPPSVTLAVRGYETVGHPGYVRELELAARQSGVIERVCFEGTVPTRQELLRLCAAGDVGLALLIPGAGDLNEQAMAGASNKAFDYMACGLAVLVPNLPDWRALWVEGGYGRACDADSADSIAREIRWFLDHPAERTAMGERGRRRILDEWNYETQFRPVRDVVAGSQGQGGPADLPAAVARPRERRCD